MKTKLKERLKDIIIDHVYDYCFNEVVRKIEGGDHKLELSIESKLDDDPFINDVFDSIKKSNEAKFYYGKRNKKYCKIIEGVHVHKTLMDKLLFQDFKKSNSLNLEINKAIQFLLYRSYLSQNQPIKAEYSLTDKGLNHYLTGYSFEEKYLQHQDSHQTRLISIVSLIIAIAAIVLPFIIS